MIKEAIESMDKLEYVQYSVVREKCRGLIFHQGSVLSSLLSIIVLEALCREIRSRCPGELLYADLALVSGTLEGQKGSLEIWKGALESKGLRVNVKKTKMTVTSENVKVK